MNEEQFRHLLELADKRDEKRYAWLRHLLLPPRAKRALLLLNATILARAKSVPFRDSFERLN